jgi:protein tyrosine/serine phosphatase
MNKLKKEIPYWEKYIWNFRDLSNFNQNIKEGRIFRSSSLVSVQKKFNISEFLKESNINTIIDLRASIEVKSDKYNPDYLNNISYKNISFNPFTQPKRFNKLYNHLSNSEVAYHYFIKKYKPQIKRVFDFIAEKSETNILIHCIAGKDRTGIIATLLHLLSGQLFENSKIDYLATVTGINENYINIIYDEILKFNGIENYLLSCKINEFTLNQIRKSFFTNQNSMSFS